MVTGGSKRRVQAACREPSKAGDLVSSRKQVRVTPLMVPNMGWEGIVAAMRRCLRRFAIESGAEEVRVAPLQLPESRRHRDGVFKRLHYLTRCLVGNHAESTRKTSHVHTCYRNLGGVTTGATM